jgi:hypothetical protein
MNESTRNGAMSVSKCGAMVAAVLGLLLGTNGSAKADFAVQVGYADDLRPSPFFPSPWQGSPNVVFVGASPNIDAGAVRIDNTGPAAFTIQNMVVDSFGDGASFAIWGGSLPLTLNPGQMAIFTQTTQYNFDTSDDQGSNPNALPQVHITIGGVTSTFVDSAQVLNTEGTDHLAASGLNESHQWRPIGTFGGQSAPEPSALALAGTGVLGLIGYGWRKRRRDVA